MQDDVLQTIDPKVLGRRLQEARKARGLTQQDVAKDLGLAKKPQKISLRRSGTVWG